MRAIRQFEEFIKERIVKKQAPDNSRANFLVKESEKSNNFLKRLVADYGVTDDNANSVIRICYDIFMELIRASMLRNGFNSAGKGAHEAEVSYMRNMNFSENDIKFADQLRYFRNGIIYYGKIMDAEYAKKVAKYINTVHHEIIFTVQEGLDAIKDVIYHLETFDVTTIRAGTPMYLMARKIKSTGIKMILSGEGADEVFGGYLYFHMAPSKREFHKETTRKLSLLSKYDCLRANKSTAAWGLETRVPFLDKEFLDYSMSIDPKYKMCPGKKIEKEILRKAFVGYLPKEILLRQKEQFSDGVGYSWIESLKKHTQHVITDKMMKKAIEKFPKQTPSTKEEYFYRQIFDEFFTCPSAALTVPIGPTIACSTPTAFRWSKEFQKLGDPSGRSVVSIHKKI